MKPRAWFMFILDDNNFTTRDASLLPCAFRHLSLSYKIRDKLTCARANPAIDTPCCST